MAGPSWNPLLANRPRKIRQQLFEPGGPLAKVMAGYSTVLQVNDSLFAHGGVLPHHGEQTPADKMFLTASICEHASCRVRQVPASPSTISLGP